MAHSNAALWQARFVARFLPTLAAVLLAAPGCGSKAPSVAPVRGQVLLEGKPIDDATIVLHPVSAGGPASAKLEAHSDPQGKFQLEQVPAGDYQLTVEWRASRFDGERSVRDGHNLLPDRYGNPAESGLKYTVVAGENEIPPLALVDSP